MSISKRKTRATTFQKESTPKYEQKDKKIEGEDCCWCTAVQTLRNKTSAAALPKDSEVQPVSESDVQLGQRSNEEKKTSIPKCSLSVCRSNSADRKAVTEVQFGHCRQSGKYLSMCRSEDAVRTNIQSPGRIMRKSALGNK